MPNAAHRSTRLTVVLSLLAISMFVMSCAKTETAETTTPPQATETGMTALSDANIAAIVVAANTIDIKNAEMANAKSQNEAVKAFAAQMITDHTSVNQQATDLVTKLNVIPEENATSQALVTSADATRDGINAKEGAEFDKAYIDNEVAYHESVIEVIDKTLIPGAQNAELKALLVSVRPAFDAHLEHARKLQADLSK